MTNVIHTIFLLCELFIPFGVIGFLYYFAKDSVGKTEKDHTTLRRIADLVMAVGGISLMLLVMGSILVAL